MKTLFILAALFISASVNISVHAEQTQRSYVADSGPVILAENTATRHMFNSRRGYRSPAVHNKKNKADDTLEGAAYIQEKEAKEAKASKRLNRQFRSKRPNMNYQFN